MKVFHPDELSEILESSINNKLSSISANLSKISDEDAKLLSYGYADTRVGANGNRYQLICSSISFQLFRGQRNSAWGLTSTAYREGWDSVKKIEMVSKQLIFNSLIMSSETYRKLYSWSITMDGFKKDELYELDSEFIARHYSMKTNVIDFTLDPQIALFFACTKRIDGQYEPITSNDLKQSLNGTIYRCNYVLNNSNSDGHAPIVIDPCLCPRPFNQFGFFINDEIPPHTYSMEFRHDCDYSESIHKKYHRRINGNSIDMSLENIAQEVSESRNIPEYYFYKAISKVECKDNPDHLRNKLESQGISFKESNFEDLKEKVNKILCKYKVHNYQTPVEIIEKCRNGHIMTRSDLYDLISMIQFNNRYYESQIKTINLMTMETFGIHEYNRHS